MKNILILLLLPLLGFAQMERAIKVKVAMMQNCIKKGEEGETIFWQTKGKITYSIVKYTDAQNLTFKELFIKQYQELVPIYNKMVVSEDEKDTSLFIQTLIKQEDEYRNLLTPTQLQLYLKQLAEFEKTNPQANDAYSALFFSEESLKAFKSKF